MEGLTRLRRVSRLPTNIFGRQISVGEYATAGFAGAVKMPCAEARGGFTGSRVRFLLKDLLLESWIT